MRSCWVGGEELYGRRSWEKRRGEELWGEARTCGEEGAGVTIIAVTSVVGCTTR